MTERTSPRRRGWPQRLWRNIHLWLGIGLFVLLVPVALSGAILVYHDDIDEMMRTPREATVSQGPVDLPLAITNAKQAAGEKFQPTVVRFPENPRAPMTISLRGQAAAKGERPPFLTAYIDRNDSRVLNLIDFRASFFGFMHVFHENLTIPFYYGRDIVGWVGVAMLTLSLTGLYLWWPRHNQWARAFAWRRSPATSSNLHYMAGFWVCFPLAFLSLTGVYLAWPQQGRSLLSSFAPITEQQRGGPQAAMANPQRSPTEIYNIATARPNSAVAAIFFPAPQTGAWRVQLREEGKSEPITILINDRSGAISTVEPLAGDRIGFWIRWLHEGSHSGEFWRLIVFVTGLMPAVLGVTGILVWLRQRRQRALMKTNQGQLAPASAPGGAISNTTPAE